MGLGNALDRAQRKIDDAEDVVRRFFEPQLDALGLSVEQIEAQNLDQLEGSLDKINSAIANPDSFGKLRISFAGEAGPIIAKSDSAAHVERGILPILLERKALILDRIRDLRPEEQLNNLRADVTENVDDPLVREQFLDIINHRFEEEREAREKLDRESAKTENERVDAWEREQRVQIEIRERKWAIYHSFIERESMASIIGAILLLALAAVLVVGMFTHTTPPEVVANAFLLVLGYFFGQTTTRAQSARESKETK